jgi:hypothetical protein
VRLRSGGPWKFTSPSCHYTERQLIEMPAAVAADIRRYLEFS